MEVAREARARLEECNDQDLGCLCYAYALYGVPSSGPLRLAANGLFLAITEKLLQDGEVDRVRTNYLCLIVWGFARAKMPPRPELYSRLCAEVVSRWETEPVQNQQVVSIAWALATTKTSAPGLLSQIALRAEPLLPRFSVNELTGMAWAFSYAKARDERLFGRLAELLHPRLSECPPRALATVAGALAGVDMEVPDTFKAPFEPHSNPI